MKADQALLIVDVQNDFLEKGALPVPRGSEVVPVINRLVPLFDFVVFTQDWHPSRHISFASSHEGKRPYETIRLNYGTQVLWPKHCVQCEKGSELAENLDASKCSLLVRKGTNPLVDSYSAFMEADRRSDTGLAHKLRENGINEVFVCGYWTALDAAENGFKTYVITDACRGIDVDGSVDKALADLKAHGVQILTSEDLLKTAS